MSPHRSCSSTNPGKVPFSCGQNITPSTWTSLGTRVLKYGSTAASVAVGMGIPLGKRTAFVPICSREKGEDRSVIYPSIIVDGTLECTGGTRIAYYNEPLEPMSIYHV